MKYDQQNNFANLINNYTLQYMKNLKNIQLKTKLLILKDILYMIFEKYLKFYGTIYFLTKF